MLTGRSLATIDYNSQEYLDSLLSNMIDNGILQFYAYIRHLGEDDEAGKKPHIHLYLEPNKRIDTAVFKKEFDEPDLSNPDAPPLGCLVFRTSDFNNWFLYALHDPDYLKSKGLEKKYHYSYSDVVTSDAGELYRMYKMLDKQALCPSAEIFRAVRSGMSWSEFVCSGKVRPEKYYGLRQIWSDCLAKVNNDYSSSVSSYYDAICGLDRQLKIDNDVLEQFKKIVPDYYLDYLPDGYPILRSLSAGSLAKGCYSDPKNTFALVHLQSGMAYCPADHSVSENQILELVGCIGSPSLLDKYNSSENKEDD